MQPTETVEPPTGDLVPDPQVWRELGITSMTLWRWTHDPKLGFPPAIKIRNRNFRSRRALEDFKCRMLRQSIAARGEAA
jgi:hypothetical protein